MANGSDLAARRNSRQFAPIRGIRVREKLSKPPDRLPSDAQKTLSRTKNTSNDFGRAPTVLGVRIQVGHHA
ncbi:MAG TPA: hypothetical protein VGP95_21440, partial [Gemmatimonadaceae bacterium]|nr:hypothetical protein [Gemmatimonadaceae bacterium]